MKKKVIFTGAGILTLIAAIVLFYLFIISLNESGNILYFIGSLVSVGFTVFGFMRATKANTSTPVVLPVSEFEGASTSIADEHTVEAKS